MKKGYLVLMFCGGPGTKSESEPPLYIDIVIFRLPLDSLLRTNRGSLRLS